MSEYNMSHTGRELDDAINKVKNGFIDKSKLTLHTTKTATGSFTGSGQTLSNIAITNIGFKPKIFLVQNQDAVWTGSDSAPYSLVGSVMIRDDNYNELEHRTSFALKGNSTNGYGRGGQSNTNFFYPITNGVQGTGSSVKASSGVKYNWWAWG